MMARSFRAAVVQLNSRQFITANIDHALPLIREAAAAGARFIQTPEMSSIVTRDRESLFEQTREESEDGFVAAMRDAARALNVTLHLGSVAVRNGDKIANRGLLISPEGEVSARYDKIHLFDVDLPSGESWRESRTYTGGDQAVLATSDLAAIGLTICYDVRFASLYRALAEAGAEILTAPACFTKQTGEAHWHILQRARAIETGAFMISAAQIGPHDDGRQTYGHSLIVDPWGKVLADGGVAPGVSYAEIDLAEVAAARSRIPVLEHGRNFTLDRQGWQAKADAA
jgi:predicted amidohydrolase